jgi:hypothetical protein
LQIVNAKLSRKLEILEISLRGNEERTKSHSIENPFVEKNYRTTEENPNTKALSKELVRSSTISGKRDAG